MIKKKRLTKNIMEKRDNQVGILTSLFFLQERNVAYPYIGFIASYNDKYIWFVDMLRTPLLAEWYIYNVFGNNDLKEGKVMSFILTAPLKFTKILTTEQIKKRQEIYLEKKSILVQPPPPFREILKYTKKLRYKQIEVIKKIMTKEEILKELV